MDSLEVELNDAEIQAFLKSDSVVSMLKGRADAIQQRCGSGYTVSTHKGRTRANASVMASSRTAIIDNQGNNTLLKALK